MLSELVPGNNVISYSKQHIRMSAQIFSKVQKLNEYFQNLGIAKGVILQV